jgi:hypothetical protein
MKFFEFLPTGAFSKGFLFAPPSAVLTKFISGICRRISEADASRSFGNVLEPR